jgi:nicotinamide-nucleotide adenylyltransferase
MRKRALFVFDWQQMTNQHFQFVEDHAVHYDELIFLLDRPDEWGSPLSPVRQLSCGGMLELLNAVLAQRLNKPFYLLPVAGKGQPDLYHWLRWKILCPSFEKAYTDKPDRMVHMHSVLQVPVEVAEITQQGFGHSPLKEELTRDILLKRTHRGLFITRAQPFHLGHAAFIEQMKQEEEEVIIVLAMANKSHQPTDIATAGERMEMVRPWLDEILPGRYYLVPLPYSDFIMENIYEMKYLLPSFNRVYTSNPTIATMATTAGYVVKSLKEPIAVSGTMIRDRMRNDQPYKDHVPETVYRYLLDSGIPERLKKLHEKETRLL